MQQGGRNPIEGSSKNITGPFLFKNRKIGGGRRQLGLIRKLGVIVKNGNRKGGHRKARHKLA